MSDTSGTTARTKPAADVPFMEPPPARGTALSDPVAEARAAHANTVVRHNVYLAAATGVIPIIFMDTAALMAVQLKLIRDLSKVYGTDFRADIGRSAVSTLMTSVAPTMLSNGLLGSGALLALKASMPVVGTAVRLGTQPAFGAAFTYAVGKVFQHHFASGGTLLSFDVNKVKGLFQRTFAEARKKPFKDIGGTSDTASAAA